MWRIISLGLLSLVSTPALAQSTVGPDSAVQMTGAQIAAHNASLTAADATFIKCVRSERPGSFVKQRTCRTNADWNRRADLANDEARSIVDKIQTSGSSRPMEPQGSVVPLDPR